MAVKQSSKTWFPKVVAGFEGFPIEMPQDSITRGNQQWKVMMHPDTLRNIVDLAF